MARLISAILRIAVVFVLAESKVCASPYQHENEAYASLQSRFQTTSTASHQQLQCNCLSITTCSRILHDNINAAYEAKRCGYFAALDEVLVCCPQRAPSPQPYQSNSEHNNDELRYRRADELRRSNTARGFDYDSGESFNPPPPRRSHLDEPDPNDQRWVWDSQPDIDETVVKRSRFNHWDMFTSNTQHHYYHNQHDHRYRLHFHVTDNAIDDHHQKNRHSDSLDAWKFHFEDADTHRNHPPLISGEFEIPNHLQEIAAALSSVPGHAVEASTMPTSPASPSIDASADVVSVLVADLPTAATAPRAVQEAQINGPNCGVSIGTRIIGGENSGPGQFPWMARLAYRNRSSQLLSYRCAGSLISDQYVLTAAHCVTNLVDHIELVLVRLGELNADMTDNLCTSGLVDCVQPQDYAIESAVHHSDYDRPKYSNDIALIRLRASSMATVAAVPPIALCLPFGDFVAADDHNGIIAGWGATSADSQMQSPTLKWIRLPIGNTTSCASAYGRFSANSQTPIIISETMQLCVQGTSNVDACQGDSGGPLMSDAMADQRYTLLGVVSFGPRTCGVSNFPGVYTRVEAYMDWILEHMRA